MYRDSKQNASLFIRYPTLNLRFESLKYNLDLTLNKEDMDNQSKNEYFTEKKGYEANLIGIVDESMLENGYQYKYIYVVGKEETVQEQWL